MSVSARAPIASPRRVKFGEAARQKRGARALAQAQSVGHAAADRVDILGRAAERDADQIVAGIGTELRMAQASPAAARRCRCAPRW